MSQTKLISLDNLTRYDGKIKALIDQHEGSGDYSDLTNKPSINNVTLSGNKTASDLSLASTTDLAGKQDKYETITYVQWQALTPAQKAAKDYYISDYPSSAITAGNVSYNNSSSGMSANNVQSAVDELKSGLNDLIINQPTSVTFDADGTGTFNIPTGYIPLMACIDTNWNTNIYYNDGTWIVRASFWNDPTRFITSGTFTYSVFLFLKA